jgi:hypothetical protein
MQMSEDIYSKMTKIQPTMFDPKPDIVAAGEPPRAVEPTRRSRGL